MIKFIKISTLLLGLTTASLISCVNFVNPIEEDDAYAPKSIIGKTIEFDSGNIKGYDFTSSGICKYYFTGETLSGTPTYSYDKTDNTTATYSANYTMLRGSTKIVHSSSFTLTFTSAFGGTYSGTSVIKISSTKTNHVSGEFTIQ
jgi:hypothetical protein